MGMLARLWGAEKRGSLENPNISLLEAFTDDASVSGRHVTKKTALSEPSVFAAVNAISSTLATLPLKVYRRSADGSRSEARDHPLWRVLNESASELMTAAAFREALMGHVLLGGNGYAYVVRNGAGRTVELLILRPDQVARQGSVYRVRVSGGSEVVPADSILHIAGLGENGVDGWSVVRFARESIGLSLSLQEYGSRFFSNDSRPSGVLTTPETLSLEAAQRLKAGWERAHSKLSQAHRVAVLEEGVKWQQTGATAEDSQFLESRHFQVAEVARWFNIPVSKLRDMDRATYSNVTQQSIEFVQDTLRPWLVRWEQAINARLLGRTEREAGLYVEHSVQALLRGDVQQRGEFYRQLYNVGAITPNEIRAREGLNKIAGGDRAFVGLNMVPLDQAATLPIRERSRLISASAEARQRSKR